VLASARRPLETAVSGDRAEHDPRSWLAGALAAGAEVVARAGSDGVEAVGIGALGAAPVLVDGTLEPLAPAPLFSLDRRAEAECARLGVTHDHALPKLLWLARNEPELVRRAAWALDSTGFLVACLTGIATMDSITRADYELPGVECPVPLPEPVDPVAVAGGLTARAADILGLPAGTPVSAGTYDTYVDVAGAGVRLPGDACILLGSTLVVCVAVDEPVKCAGLELTPFPGEGFLLGGWTTAGGATLAWFGRELGEPPAVAGLEPGAGGLVALPYLAGERTPIRDPDARGLVLGLTLATTRPELYRALVDGVALSARDHLERLRSAGLAPAFWLTAGGGTRDDAWLQATADALGAELRVVAHAAEAVGPAHLALRALGIEPVRPVERLVVPDERRHARFEELYALYRDLYAPLAGAMRRLGGLKPLG
jgi:xylulokinase